MRRRVSFSNCKSHRKRKRWKGMMTVCRSEPVMGMRPEKASAPESEALQGVRNQVFDHQVVRCGASGDVMNSPMS
jgi:hypothetical protein